MKKITTIIGFGLFLFQPQLSVYANLQDWRNNTEYLSCTHNDIEYYKVPNFPGTKCPIYKESDGALVDSYGLVKHHHETGYKNKSNLALDYSPLLLAVNKFHIEGDPNCRIGFTVVNEGPWGE